ncbi:MAG: DUF3489 domain-containing protein [Magnetococcales bacterium]|nr:DUF3489 domain-containing protein [Magnetococcales bacterium]
METIETKEVSVQDILDSVFTTATNPGDARQTGSAARLPKAINSQHHHNVVMLLLHRPCGVTQQQITDATGWNAANTRMFFSMAHQRFGVLVSIKQTLKDGVKTISYSVVEQAQRSA